MSDDVLRVINCQEDTPYEHRHLIHGLYRARFPRISFLVSSSSAGMVGRSSIDTRPWRPTRRPAEPSRQGKAEETKPAAPGQPEPEGERRAFRGCRDRMDQVIGGEP